MTTESALGFIVILLTELGTIGWHVCQSRFFDTHRMNWYGAFAFFFVMSFGPMAAFLMWHCDKAGVAFTWSNASWVFVVTIFCQQIAAWAVRWPSMRRPLIPQIGASDAWHVLSGLSHFPAAIYIAWVHVDRVLWVPLVIISKWIWVTVKRLAGKAYWGEFWTEAWKALPWRR